MPSQNEHDRFWSKIGKRSDDECWPWNGARSPRGYGRYHAPGTAHGCVLAHRMAHELTSGPVPQGMSVLHSCDNPPCCNPKHLRVGTTADNVRDMHDRGRQARGEGVGGAKLTDLDVACIRMCYEMGVYNQYEIACAFRIGQARVSDIVNRKSWAHVNQLKPIDVYTRANDALAGDAPQ